MGMGDWWPESEEARDEATDIINYGQEGLDEDGVPFSWDDEDDD